MNELIEANNKALNIFNGNKNNSWIEWIHEQRASNCCDVCISLGGCYFLSSKMPAQPVHPKCHCETKPIDNPIVGVDIQAKVDEKKFKEYALIFKSKSDKSGWFLKYGYDIMDTDYLVQEYFDQAAIKYAAGEYELERVPTNWGQKVKIIIVLPDRIKGGTVRITSIWMVEPNGKICLKTPIVGVERS